MRRNISIHVGFVYMDRFNDSYKPNIRVNYVLSRVPVANEVFHSCNKIAVLRF